MELTSADTVLDIAVKICEIAGNLGFPESVCRGSVEAYWVKIAPTARTVDGLSRDLRSGEPPFEP